MSFKSVRIVIGVPLNRIRPAQLPSHLNTMKSKYIMQGGGGGGKIDISVYVCGVQENCRVLNESRVLDVEQSAVLGVKFHE